MGCDIHAYVETSYVDRPHVGWNQLCEYRFGRNYALFALMAGVRRYSLFPSADSLERELKKRGVAMLDDPRLSEDEVGVILEDAKDNGITNGVPSFKPKGCPKDICYRTNSEWSLHIIEDDSTLDEPGYVKRSRAMTDVEKGYAEVWEEHDGEVVSITNSDWHTASWLDTSEIGVLIERLKKTLEGYIEDSKNEQEMSIRWSSAALKRARTDGTPEDVEKAERDLQRAERWSSFDPMRSEILTKVEALYAMMTAFESKGALKARLVFWFDN